MAKTRNLVIIAFLFILCSAKVNNTSHDKPDWMKMNELNEKIKSETKPVLIDLYTN